GRVAKLQRVPREFGWCKQGRVPGLLTKSRTAAVSRRSLVMPVRSPPKTTIEASQHDGPCPRWVWHLTPLGNMPPASSQGSYSPSAAQQVAPRGSVSPLRLQDRPCQGSSGGLLLQIGRRWPRSRRDWRRSARSTSLYIQKFCPAYTGAFIC